MTSTDDIAQAITDAMRLDADRMSRRRAFLEFGDDDTACLRDLGQRLAASGDDFVGDFYTHLLGFEETARIVADPAFLQRLRTNLNRYFQQMMSGPYDAAYVGERRHLGAIHHAKGLKPEWVLGAYCWILTWTVQRLAALYTDQPDRALRAATALVKVVFLDLNLTHETYVEADRRALADARCYADQIIASIPDGLLVLTDDLRVQISNRAFHHWFGLEAADIRGRALSDLFPVVGLPELARNALHRGLTLDAGRLRLSIAGGQPVPVRITVAPVLVDPLPGGVQHLLMVFQDLSDEERANAAERRFREVVENATDGVLLSDQDGKITYVNPAGQALFGYGPGDMVDMDLRELIPVPLESGGPVRRLDGRRRDGSIVPLECTTSSCRIDDQIVHTAMLRDVTDRLRVQRALQRSERSFRELIEQSPEAITVHRDGRFVYVNPTVVQMLGYDSHRDLVGQPVSAIVHPDDRAVVAARIQQMMLSGLPAPPREERFVRKDGSVVLVEVIGLVLEYHGQPSFVAIGRDLTERQALRTRMMEMDRMIAVGTLAAGVGHEINNPLTYVDANIHVALERIVDLQALTDGAVDVASVSRQLRVGLAELQQVLGDASHGSERIRVVVEDLRNLSQDQDDDRVPVPIQEILSTAIKMARHEVRHRARLVTDFDTLPMVVGNASRLGQVFLNLLVNAAQSIPVGHADRHQVSVRARQVGDQVAIEISDSGAGIDPKDLSKLFDPFFTTKPIGQGTGLGLAICRQIVDDHGGRIQAESTLGQGSLFRVLLPVAPALQEQAGAVAAPAAPASAASPALAKEAHRGHILIVDDEPMIARLAKRILGAQHRIETLESAQEALDRIQSGTRYDLVLCDLMMPSMTGMELYQRVLEYDPTMARRMVFMTGGAFTPQARSFLAEHGRPQVDKPFDPSALRALVAGILSKG
ncbi:MAG: PAS domain S-box protein [Oligoflexia bacterium]|nr:PAS domain S-box protein [Oligoflexia bacterium]